MIETERTSQLM